MEQLRRDQGQREKGRYMDIKRSLPIRKDMRWDSREFPNDFWAVYIGNGRKEE